MSHRRRSLILLVLVALLAAGAAPWRSLPPCLIGKWTGITATDADGNLIGPEDPGDWGCVGDAPGVGSALRPGDVPAPPPTRICFLPAAPNPASPTTRLAFALPTPGRATLVIYGKQGKGPHGAFPVRTLLDGELPAGMFSALWDGRDDGGAAVEPGIYRALLTVGENSLCGDIEIR